MRKPSPDPVLGDAVVRGEAAVTNDDPLGGARGARGVHDVGHVVDVHLVADIGGIRVEEVTPGNARGPDGPGGGDQGPQMGRAGGIVEDALAGQNDLHPGQVENAQLLRPAQACVHRDGDGPRLVNGHIGREPLQRLAGGDGQGDPISGPEAARRACRGPADWSGRATRAGGARGRHPCSSRRRRREIVRPGRPADRLGPGSWLRGGDAVVVQYGSPPSRIVRGFFTSMLSISASLTPRSRMTGRTSVEM